MKFWSTEFYIFLKFGAFGKMLKIYGWKTCLRDWVWAEEALRVLSERWQGWRSTARRQFGCAGQLVANFLSADLFVLFWRLNGNCEKFRNSFGPWPIFPDTYWYYKDFGKFSASEMERILQASEAKFCLKWQIFMKILIIAKLTNFGRIQLH